MFNPTTKEPLTSSLDKLKGALNINLDSQAGAPACPGFFNDLNGSMKALSDELGTLVGSATESNWQEIQTKLNVANEIATIGAYAYLCYCRNGEKEDGLPKELRILANTLAEQLKAKLNDSGLGGLFTSQALGQSVNVASSGTLNNDIIKALVHAAGGKDSRGLAAKVLEAAIVKHNKQDRLLFFSDLFTKNLLPQLDENLKNAYDERKTIVSTLINSLIHTEAIISSCRNFFIQLSYHKFIQDVYDNGGLCFDVFSSYQRKSDFFSYSKDRCDGNVKQAEAKIIGQYVRNYPTYLSEVGITYTECFIDHSDISKYGIVMSASQSFFGLNDDTKRERVVGLGYEKSSFIDKMFVSLNNAQAIFRNVLEWRSESTELQSLALNAITNNFYNSDFIKLLFSAWVCAEKEVHDAIAELATDSLFEGAAPDSKKEVEDKIKGILNFMQNDEKQGGGEQELEKIKSLLKELMLRKFQVHGIRYLLNMLSELREIKKTGGMSDDQKIQFDAKEKEIKASIIEALKRPDFIKWMTPETVRAILEYGDDSIRAILENSLNQHLSKLMLPVQGFSWGLALLISAIAFLLIPTPIDLIIKPLAILFLIISPILIVCCAKHNSEHMRLTKLIRSIEKNPDEKKSEADSSLGISQSLGGGGPSISSANSASGAKEYKKSEKRTSSINIFSVFGCLFCPCRKRSRVVPEEIPAPVVSKQPVASSS